MQRQRVDVSLSSLKDELRQAQEQETKHQNENDSKLRAVAQHMDYDQFRQMVLGANLRCTKSGEISNIHSGTAEKPLNASYRLGNEEPVAAQVAVEGRERITVTQFRRQWKAGDRWNVLKQAESYLESLFPHGLECDYVAEIIDLAYRGLVTGEYVCSPAEWAPIWTRVRGYNGFEQGLKMLSRKEKANYEAVTQTLL